MTRHRPLLILLAAVSTNSSAADLGKGLDAAARMDWPAALNEFKPLAELGNSNAQVNLGNLYMRGLGVDQSDQEGLRWYMLAAQQGNRTAQGKIGLIYYHGLGVEANHAEAIDWFIKAANQGDPESAIILGTLYASGDGVPRNRVQAYLWYSVAADRGKRVAIDERIALANEMTPGEIGEALGELEAWRTLHEPPMRDPEILTAPKEGAADRKAAEAKSPPPKPRLIDKTLPKMY